MTKRIINDSTYNTDHISRNLHIFPPQRLVNDTYISSSNSVKDDQRFARYLRKEILASKRRKLNHTNVPLFSQPKLLSKVARARMKEILDSKRSKNLQGRRNATPNTITPISCVTYAGPSKLGLSRRRKADLISDTLASVTTNLFNSGFEAECDEVIVGETTENVFEGYFDIGDPTYQCQECGALMFFQERIIRRGVKKPRFNLCCRDGLIELPYLTNPPELLRSLLAKEHPYSNHFIENIRAYNMMFAFTSMGGKIDRAINNGSGPYTFRLGGQNYHLIGSLLPKDHVAPKFCQLYIYDTEDEVSNRKNAVSSTNSSRYRDDLIQDLKEMIDCYNPLAKGLRMARDKINFDVEGDVQLRLISNRKKDPRIYNLPTACEIAALVTGGTDERFPKRDIIIENKSGELRTINELNPSYLALQYPLLFPYGEDGHQLGIPHRGEEYDECNTSNNSYKSCTMREWMAFRIQDRPKSIEPSTLLSAGKLTQQFIVDGYTVVETHRLNWSRFNQDLLRCGNYKELSKVVSQGNADSSKSGSRNIIPANFLGGFGYARDAYHDTMGICRWFGYPDLFITFTCNSKWPEIERYMKRMKKCSPLHRAYIIVRVFYIKLQELMRDLKDREIFGAVKACMCYI